MMDFAPHATWTQWLTDATSAAQGVTDGLDWASSGWLVGIAAAIGLLGRYGHLLGPAGAAAGALAQGLAKAVLPKEQHEAAARMAVAEDSLWRIVETIEALDSGNPLVAQMKKTISSNTPAEFNALFDAWKKEREGR